MRDSIERASQVDLKRRFRMHNDKIRRQGKSS